MQSNINKYYKSNVGLWKHNQIYHKLDNIDKNDVINNIKEYICIYCNKKYTNKFSKYKHQNKCKIKNTNEIEKIKSELNVEINKLKLELEEIKNKPACVTNIRNINKGVINNNKVSFN